MSRFDWLRILLIRALSDARRESISYKNINIWNWLSEPLRIATKRHWQMIAGAVLVMLGGLSPFSGKSVGHSVQHCCCLAVSR
ncbi:hypothetical protein [Thalassolituus marinus]|uniref:Uncharacterized protein n=1 Tax=Thalassolituus marinus TaxID=671053 RepID=A0ABS7ZRG4_9GAMM|nr:hypothetical protein [Thalassolituus marinus]MCA6064269.1 hypothetical protein [Thalassolituus marinus]